MHGWTTGTEQWDLSILRVRFLAACPCPTPCSWRGPWAVWRQQQQRRQLCFLQTPFRFLWTHITSVRVQQGAQGQVVVQHAWLGSQVSQRQHDLVWHLTRAEWKPEKSSLCHFEMKKTSALLKPQISPWRRHNNPPERRSGPQPAARPFCRWRRLFFASPRHALRRDVPFRRSASCENPGWDVDGGVLCQRQRTVINLDPERWLYGDPRPCSSWLREQTHTRPSERGKSAHITLFFRHPTWLSGRSGRWIYGWMNGSLDGYGSSGHGRATQCL